MTGVQAILDVKEEENVNHNYNYQCISFYYSFIVCIITFNDVILYLIIICFFLLFTFDCWAMSFMHYLTNTSPHTQLYIIMFVAKIFKYKILFQTFHKLFLRIIPMAVTSSKQLKNVCLLSGFHYDKYEEFVIVAMDLSRVIAEKNYSWCMEKVTKGYES